MDIKLSISDKNWAWSTIKVDVAFEHFAYIWNPSLPTHRSASGKDCSISSRGKMSSPQLCTEVLILVNNFDLCMLNIGPSEGLV